MYYDLYLTINIVCTIILINIHKIDAEYRIQLLMILSPEIQQNIVINLTPLRIKIIELFGYKAMEIYGLLTKTDLNINKSAA